MNTEEVSTLIESMNAEMAETRKRFQERMREVFKDAFKQFFADNPEVTCVSWRQYTPYFNDGDPCVFRCYADYAAFTNATDYTNVRWGEYDGDGEGVWVLDRDYGGSDEELMPKGLSTKADKFCMLLGKIDTDVFLQTFGDHCIVYATRDGFETSEYEHD